MKILHFCAGLEFWNGMANTARQFMAEEIAAGHDSLVTNNLAEIRAGVDVVYIHGAWLPILWKSAKQAKRINAKLIVRPAGSYDPVRLGYHRWKKKFVAFFEHRMLRKADVLLATCEAEAEWIRDYVGKSCPKVEVTDLRRFFKLGVRSQESGVSKQGDNSKLNVLYLGRRHPLKGIEYLESAVKELNHGIHGTHGNVELKIVSDAKGEELEQVWAWCDVLVLPTLSENFGRVIAEALERGKPVITTDGAPAWGEGLSHVERVDRIEGELRSGFDGRLLYLKGYRDGSDEMRVKLLKNAILVVSGMRAV